MDDFEEIHGYAAAKEELRQIADYLRDPERYDAMGSRMPAGLLISGKPGLGKTLMASCLISASGLPSVTCRKAKRGGEMLKQIRKAFASAAAIAPSILLLDDVDKFSNSNHDLCDTEEYVTIQSCIDESRNGRVFVVATANDEEKLPESLLRERRFDRQIALDSPTGHDALAITQHFLEGIACADDVDAQDVADIVEGCSCALIKTVANEASLLAGFEQAPAVTLAHFIRAFARAKGEGSLSELSAADPQDLASAWATGRAMAAYHEAGHVVVDEALCPGRASVALLTENQGRIAGLTKRRRVPPQGTVAEARADVLVTLAGGIAVERKYGVPCLGCESDNMQVADALGRLLKDASLLGPYYVGTSRWSGSEAHEDATERACAIVVELCRWDVREVLARHWDAVEAIAGALYRKGYVLPGDIAYAMGERARAGAPGARGERAA